MDTGSFFGLLTPTIYQHCTRGGKMVIVALPELDDLLELMGLKMLVTVISEVPETETELAAVF